jgi:hypothetical protein
VYIDEAGRQHLALSIDGLFRCVAFDISDSFYAAIVDGDSAGLWLTARAIEDLHVANQGMAAGQSISCKLGIAALMA